MPVAEVHVPHNKKKVQVYISARYISYEYLGRGLTCVVIQSHTVWDTLNAINLAYVVNIPHLSRNQFLTNSNVTHLKSKLVTYSTKIWCDYASMMPIRGFKMANNADIGTFWTCFCYLWVYYRPLVARLVHMHVEEIWSFDLRGVTSKSVNNWLQK